ncbi:MAG: RraA family protein [Chloroflexi bacterium]|nr:RraA family protein [Chloroflexota bacterium]MBI3733483.1 RraA family protein [Chloroflexota bacterium]
MPNLLTAAQIAELQKFATPSISNGIETFNIRPRNQGFMSPEIRCMFPEMPPMVGYAFTVKIRAAYQAEQPRNMGEYRRAVLAAPGPKIIVVQDLDDPVIGSLWGEVNGNVHKALGAVGTVTNGGVRDLNEARALGFHFFAKEVLVSHAYVHVEDWGAPVEVGGLTIKPGDLLHGDLHGVIHMPDEIAHDIAAATAEVERKERIVINACQSPDFSIEKLEAAFKEMRGY